MNQQNSGSSINLDTSQGLSNGQDPTSPRVGKNPDNGYLLCPCCLNNHANVHHLRHSHSSLSSPIDNMYPSGGSSSYGRDSLMQKLNHSPTQTRTLDCETHVSSLGNCPNEQTYRSGNIGAELMYRQHRHSQMLLPGHMQHSHTPKSHHQKSSTHTKSASGSQNASSTSQRGHNRTNNDEPVKIELVKQAKDLRTYLCVKNIPCSYSKKQLKEEINKQHKGRYYTIDPIPDKKEPEKTTNKGYFFIGFKHPLFVVDFYEQYQGKVLEPSVCKNKVGIYYGHNPRSKDCHHPSHKPDKDSFVMSELRKIIEKYDIQTPLDLFNRQSVNANTMVSTFPS